MRRIFTSMDRTLVAHFQNLLEGRGIRCFVKNDQLQTAMGEVPPIECWAELWVVDASRWDEARQLLGDGGGGALAETGGAPWTCDTCNEPLEPQFDACWQCGAARAGGGPA